MDNLIEIIISAMGTAQINKYGDNKKNYVLSVLKCNITNEDFLRYEPLINNLIDLFKNIANNKYILKDLKQKINCFSCID